MSDTLIVIPVRGNSVGIPRKALRPLAGVSPFLRTLQTAYAIGADVAVTTDDEEIRALVHEHPPRDGLVRLVAEPSQDGSRALDWCVHNAVVRTEQDPMRGPYQIVVTMQATSPFTTVETVQRCIHLCRELHTTVLTVRDDRGLRWTMSANEPHLTTRAPRRITRQQMDPTWRETGAVFATPRQYVTPTFRFAETAYLLPVSGKEAIDLDAPEDWAVAEWYAGAPSTRELLLSRILCDRTIQTSGLIVKLSAWDEETDDTSFRDAMLARLSGRTVAPVGQNTYHEATLAIESKMVWIEEDVLILTSAYHQVRAFLTFLKVLQERGLDRTVRLWNVPAASRMDKLNQEWGKIAEYQAKGHVASLEDGLAYLDWRDRHAEVACAT